MVGKVAVRYRRRSGHRAGDGGAFRAEGMKVVVADIVPALVEETTGELADRGLEITGMVMDVTSLESVEGLRDATIEGMARSTCCATTWGSVGIRGSAVGAPRQRSALVPRRQLTGVVNGINVSRRPCWPRMMRPTL